MVWDGGWDGAHAADFLLRKRRLYPRTYKSLVSSLQRLLKKMSVEQMRRKCRARLNGIVRLRLVGWQEVLRRY